MNMVVVEDIASVVREISVRLVEVSVMAPYTSI
jgi:hypothetical protein